MKTFDVSMLFASVSPIPKGSSRRGILARALIRAKTSLILSQATGFFRKSCRNPKTPILNPQRTPNPKPIHEAHPKGGPSNSCSEDLKPKQ